MLTISKTGNLKLRLFVAHMEPTSVKQTLSQPPWLEAMKQEYNALMRNNTWTLTPLSTNRNSIGCKWVYRIKEKTDSSINKYKAHLVAKGYNQQAGQDYRETFPLL